MTRIGAVVLAAALLGGACGGGGAGPETTFRAFTAAVRAEDWGAVHDLLTDDARNRMKTPWELARSEGPDRESICAEFGIDPEKAADISFREFFIAMTATMAEREPERVEALKSAEFLSAEVAEEGNRAVVRCRRSDGEAEMELRKVGGIWRVAEIE